MQKFTKNVKKLRFKTYPLEIKADETRHIKIYNYIIRSEEEFRKGKGKRLRSLKDLRW